MDGWMDVVACAGVELGRAMLCFTLLCFSLLYFALLCFTLLYFALLLCFALLCFTLSVNTLAAEREGLGANQPERPQQLFSQKILLLFL